MKGRRELFLALAVIAAFAAGLAWLQQRINSGYKPPKPPYSTFSGAQDGCLALYLLLEQSGFRPQRFTGSAYDYPDQGCVVVLGSSEFGVVFGGTVNPKRARLWMQEGGWLVIGCDDYMEFQLDALLEELEPEAKDAFNTVTPAAPLPALAAHERSGQIGEPSAMLRPYQGGEVYRLAPGASLWEGVETFEVAQPGYSGYSAVKDFKVDTLLATYDPSVLSPPAYAVIRYKTVGKGALLILDRPEFLSNGWINRADNHRLALNLFTFAAPGRPLLFDEGALGYSSREYNGITMITRTLGGRLLIALTAVLALFWLGQAIRPARSLPQPVPPRRHGAEMVYAQASLLLRANARPSVAESLAAGLRRSCTEAGLPRAPSDRELAEWATRAASSHAAPRAELAALAAYLRERFLPPSGSELAALARATDYLRGLLRRGERP